MRIKYKQIAPEAYSVLTDGAGVILDCLGLSLVNQKITTVQGAISFTFSNFVAGSVFNLAIIKTNTGDTTLTFPDSTSAVLSNSIASSYFFLTVRYDGTNYYILSSASSSLSQAQQFTLNAQMFRMFS